MTRHFDPRRARLLSGASHSALGKALSSAYVPQVRIAPPKTATKSKAKTAQRRTQIEALEPRVLLNADLTGQAFALTQGAQALESWIGALESHQALAASVPVINRSLGAAVDFGGTFATYVSDKIEDYLDAASGAFMDATPTGDELAAALSGTFNDALGQVTVAVSHAGADAVFGVSLTRSVVQAAVPLDLGANDGGLGITFASGAIDLTFSAAIDLEFGLDATGFYVTPATLTATAAGTATDIAATADLGFVDLAGMADAAVNATATVTPAQATLRVADLSGAVDATAALSGSANLTLRADAGFGAETFVLDWAGALDSAVASSSLQDLADFGDLDAADLSGLFDAAAGFLDRLNTDALLDDLPFFGDRLKTLADPAQVLADTLGQLNFTDLADLQAQLLANADLSDLGLRRVDLDGDGQNDAIVMDIGFSTTRSGALALDWTEQGVFPLDLLAQANADVTVAGQLGFGVDLRGADPTLFLMAGDAAPAVRLTTSLTGLDAAARLGFLDVAVTDGTAAADITLRLEQGDGAAVIPLATLTGALIDPAAFAVVEGALSVSLPLSAPGIPGLPATLTAAWADIAAPATFTTNAGDLIALTDWDTLSEDTLRQALNALPEVLRKLADRDFASNLPVIGDQLAALADFAAEVEAALAALAAFDDPASLEAALQAIFDGAEVILSATGLEIALNTSGTFDSTLDVNVAQNVGTVGTLTLNGQAAVTGTHGLDLRLGVLLNPSLAFEDRVYLTAGSATSVELGARISTPVPFTANATIGPSFLTIEARNATITAGARNQDGTLHPTDGVTLSTQLVDPGTSAADGRATLRELGGVGVQAFAAPTVNGRLDAAAELATSASVATVPVSMTWRLDQPLTAPVVNVVNANLQALLPSSVANILGAGTLSAEPLEALRQIAGWLDELGRATLDLALLDVELPVIGLTLGEAMDFAATLGDIGVALAGVFDTTAVAEDIAAAASAALETLETGLRTVTVNPATLFSGIIAAADTNAATLLGLVPGRDLFVMQIGIEVSQSLADRLIALVEPTTGLTLNAQLTGNAKVRLNLTIGADLNPLAAPAEALFLRLDSFAASVDAGLNAASATGVQLGVLDLSLQGSNLRVQAEVLGGVATDGALPPPLTLAEIQGLSPEGLLNLRVGTSLISGTLSLRASLTGLSTGTTTLTFAGDPFSGVAPTVTVTGALQNDLQNFAQMDANTLLTGLRTFAQWLSSISDADFMQANLPFSDATVGDLLDWGVALTAAIDANLLNDEGFANFDNLSEFVARMLDAAGIPAAAISTRYDNAGGAKRLDFTITLNHNFFGAGGLNAGFDAAAGIPKIANLTSDGMLSLDASGQLVISFGFDLALVQTVLAAVRPPPATGRLDTGTRAQFSLLLSDGRRVDVELDAVRTATNATVADLAQDLQAAISTALQAGAVNPDGTRSAPIAADAITVGTKVVNGATVLTLTAHPDLSNSLVFSSDKTDPATLILGFGKPQDRAALIAQGETALPADGRLTGDAAFRFAIGNRPPETITIRAVDTAGNTTRAQLVAQVNLALQPFNAGRQAAGLPPLTATSSPNGTIRFSVSDGDATLLMEIAATDAGGAAQLGFTETVEIGAPLALQVASADILSAIYVDDILATANVSVDGTLNAAAQFGVVDLSLNNAVVNLDGTIRLDLKNGLFYLADLLDPAMLGTFFTIPSTGAPGFSSTLTGTLQAPVTVAGPVATLLSLTGTETLTLTVPDAFKPSGWTISLPNLGEIGDLSNLTAAKVAEALLQLGRLLEKWFDDTALGADIPVIGEALSGLLDLADRVITLATDFSTNPTAALAALEADLEALLGGLLPNPDALRLIWDIPTQSLLFDLTLRATATDTADLELDLSKLGIGSVGGITGLTSLLDASGAAKLAYSASAEARLLFGLNLSTDALNVFIDEASGLTVGLFAEADDLEFSLAVGPLGVFVDNGHARISATADNTAEGTLTFGLSGAAGTRYRITDLLNAASSSSNSLRNRLEFTHDIRVDIDLPVDFPTRGQNLGTISLDIPNLGAVLNKIIRGQAITSGDFSFTAPDFAAEIADLNLLGSFDAIGAGIDFALGQIEGVLRGELLGIELPLVGDGLADAADFIGDLRAEIRGAIAAYGALPGEVFNKILTTLVDIFGNTIRDTNEDGLRDAHDIGLVFTDGNGANQTWVFGSTYGGNILTLSDVQLMLNLGQTETFASDPISLDFGLPGLGLELTSGTPPSVSLEWSLDFGFGLNRSTGFYLLTNANDAIGTNGENAEFRAALVASVGEDLTAVGTLGIIEAVVRDGATDTGVTGAVWIDLKGGVGRRIQMGNLSANNLDAGWNLAATLDLDLSLGFGFGDDLLAARNFPSFAATLRGDWGIGSDGGMRDIDIALYNIGLNPGEFITGLIVDVFGPIVQYLEPLQPLLDILSEPLPLLSDVFGRPITLVDLAKLFGQGDVAEFLQSVSHIVSIVSAITAAADSISKTGLLILADKIDLSGQGLGNATSNLSNIDFTSGILGGARSDVLDNFRAVAGSGVSNALGSFGSEDVSGFDIPLLTNPLSALGLIFGQDIALITYDMPALTLGFEYRQSIPIWAAPPINLVLGGGLYAGIDMKFGYDTAGIRKFIDSGDAADLLAGLYIDDTVENGVDKPIAFLRGQLTGGASIGFPGLSVGAEAGIRAEILFDLFDGVRPEHAGEYKGEVDGRVRFDEILENIEKGGPLCFLDISGRLSFIVNLVFEYVFSSKNVNVLDITLLDFDIDTCFGEVPQLARFDAATGNLILNVGADAGLRGGGLEGKADEAYEVKAQPNGKVQVKAFGYVQTFGEDEAQLITGIRGDFGSGNDALDLIGNFERRGGGAMSIDIAGGDGNDTLAGSENDDTLWGGDGDDDIRGRGGNDQLYGGTFTGGIGVDVIEGDAGDDLIVGGNGADNLGGGAGNDTVWAGGGSDVVSGGVGDDVLIAGEGGDVVFGEDGNDALIGGGAADILIGGSGNDVIEGGSDAGLLPAAPGPVQHFAPDGVDGADFMVGDSAGFAFSDNANTSNEAVFNLFKSATGYAQQVDYGVLQSALPGADEGNDTLRGNAGHDWLIGQGGADMLQAGDGDDRVLAGAGDDTVTSGVGADSVEAGAGADSVLGEGGNDTLLGGAGADTLLGGDGADSMVGGAGADSLTGGANNDTLLGNAGNDTLSGDDGDDVLRGQEDNDRLLGGTGADSLTGDAGADTILAGAGNDTLLGGAGADSLSGETENDTIYGGDGADTLDAGAGNDLTLGNAGADRILGQAGLDTIYGGAGADSIDGGTQADQIWGEADADTIRGGQGADLISGGTENDSIDAGTENDTVEGNEGADSIVAGAGNDTIDGNAGADTIRGDAGADLIRGGTENDSIDAGTENDTVEGNDGADSIHGGTGDDVISGNAGADTIRANDGDDAVDGGADNDLLLGEAGADTVAGVGGDDTIYGGSQNDSLSGGDGEDLILGETGNDTVTGGAGRDLLRGGAGDDSLAGDAGDDLILGETGNDSLSGGDDADVMEGGLGNDTIAGDAGLDTLLGGAGTDSLSGGADDDLLRAGGGTSNVLDGGTGADRIFGADVAGLLGDLILGGDGADTILGFAGNDTIDAGDGADSVLGGRGADSLTGGTGRDTLWGEADDDTLAGGDDLDQLLGGIGNDRLAGDAEDDHLDGGLGRDTLAGGAGDDRLIAGGGQGDSLSGDAGDDVITGSDDGGDIVSGGDGRDRIETLGGNDTARGDAGDDVIDTGAGDDLIEGGAGRDTLDGGNDDDVIHGTATGQDGVADEVDILFGRLGDDRLFGGAGNDLMFGGLGNDDITAGPGTSDVVEYGNPGDGAGAGAGAGAADPVIVPVLDTPAVLPALPTGIVGGAGWSVLSGLAGLSLGDAGALTEGQFAIATAADGARYVAWVDAGLGGLRVARQVGDGWQAIGGLLNAEGLGFASIDTLGNVALTVDSSGAPVLGWVESGAQDMLHVRRWTGAAWTVPAPALNLGAAGSADQLMLAARGAGFVAAWRDAAGVSLRMAEAGAWTSVGAAPLPVADAGVVQFDLAVAATGEVALAVALDMAGVLAVEVTAFTGGAWSNLGRATTPHPATEATVAWANGALYLAYVADPGSLGELPVIAAQRWTAGSWTTLTVAGNVPTEIAGTPRLASDGTAVHLAWQGIRTEGTGLRIDAQHRVLSGTAFQQGIAGPVLNTAIDPQMARLAGFDLHVANGTAMLGFVAAADAGPGAAYRGLVTLTGTPAPIIAAATLAAAQLALDTAAAGTTIVLAEGVHAGNLVIARDGLALVGAGPATQITGDITVTGANITLSGFGFGDLTATGADGLTLKTLRFDAATLAGGTGIGIERVTMTGVLSLGGQTGLRVQANDLRGGIFVGQATDVVIAGNAISASGTGLNISAAVTGGIHGNTIAGGTTGVNYVAAAPIWDNLISGVTGVYTSVNDAATAFGATGRNTVMGTTTGVRMVAATLVNTDVVGGATGISGSGLITGADLAGGVTVTGSTTGVGLFTGRIEHLTARETGVGVMANDGQDILRSVFWRTGEAAIRTAGADRVQIEGVTILALTGDGVHVSGASTEVEILSSVIEVHGGAAIRVENNSQTGFFSDYNLLHAEGTGLLVFWTRAFDDILDWQMDLARFDLHSQGTTRINPALSRPVFADRSLGDLTILPTLAGLTQTSLAAETGDPATLADRAGFTANLLANAGFDAGLTGWTVNALAAHVATGGFQNGGHFTAGSVALGFAEQVVALDLTQFTPAQIDAGLADLVFGGRLRSDGTGPFADAGSITLTFLDSNGNAIGAGKSIDSSNPGDRWERLSDRVEIPAGARQILFRFEAERDGTGANLARLDSAFAVMVSARQGTNAGAVPVSVPDADAPRLRLVYPDLYTDWERSEPLAIRWESFGNTAGSPVRISLWQDSADGPAFLMNVVAATPNDGEFIFIPETAGLNFGTHGLRVQISLVDAPHVFDRADEPFSIPEDGSDYFVDDASNADDAFTPDATGDNRNTGKTALAPKSSPLNLLRAYQLGAGATLHLDTGEYPSLDTLTISGTYDYGFGLDEGFTLQGSTTGVAAIFPVLGAGTNRHGIVLHDADFVTITDVTLRNADRGLWAFGGSGNLNISDLVIRDMLREGIRIEDGQTGSLLANLDIRNTGGDGIFMRGALAGIANVVLRDIGGDGIDMEGALTSATNIDAEGITGTGIRLTNTGTGTLTASRVHDAGLGVYVNNSTGSFVIGSTDLTAGLGVRVSDIRSYGLEVYSGVTVAGSSVDRAGSAAGTQAGIYLGNGADALFNVVSRSDRGIEAVSGSMVQGNRIYGNGSEGIYTYYGASLLENVIYSNGVGILMVAFGATAIANNLVYANSSAALRVTGSGPITVRSNTLVQSGSGQAVDITSGGTGVTLGDNIIVASAGATGVRVDPNAQATFASDTNLFHTTGGASVGVWQNVTRTSLSDWRNASFTDGESIAGDPLFVSPAGADGVIGFDALLGDGRDDNFHLQSLNGQETTAALAPVRDAVTGLPVMLASSRVAGSAQSIGIDRASLGASVGAEPSPNGGYRNLGAYGGTAQASNSPEQFILITDPTTGDAVQRGDSVDIDWRAAGFTGTVEIDIVDAEGLVTTIADATANDGVFTWVVGNDLLTGQYRIRITSTDTPAVTGQSDAFGVVAPITVYYVNDTTTAGDQYTTAVGSADNDGLSAATPMDSLRRLLETYDLGAGDIVFVDAGTYTLTANIVLDETVSGSGVERENRFIIRGPDAPGSVAVFNRASEVSTAFVFDITGDFISVENLTLRSGYDAVNLRATAANVELRDLTIIDPNQMGVRIATGSTGHLLDDVSARLGSYGIYSQGTNITVTGGAFFDNSYGAYYAGTGGIVTGGRYFGNTYGIESTTAALTGVIVHDNSNRGLYLSGGSLTDASVYGHRSAEGAYAFFDTRVTGGQFFDNILGLRVGYGAVATGVQVFANATGVELEGYYSTATLENSRIFDNRDVNVSVVITSSATAFVRNNVIYGATPVGLRNTATTGARIDVSNNTFYMASGIAVQSTGTAFLNLSSNIFDMDSGTVFAISAPAQPNFTANRNLFHLTGDARFGDWGGLSLVGQSAWFFATGQDADSLLGDPQFADPDGADNILGWNATTPVSVQTLENGGPEFATSDVVTPLPSGRGGNQSQIAANGSATWTATGIQTGGFYRIWATWSQTGTAEFGAIYEVYDGDTLLMRESVDQRAAPGTMIAGETPTWRLIGIGVPVTDTLRIVLRGANGRPLLADAVRIEQLGGNLAEDDDFRIADTSPARDNAALDRPFIGEGADGGGRADIGAFGGTANAAVSPAESLQILSPNGFAKIEVGEATRVDIRTDGLRDQAVAFLANIGGAAVAEGAGAIWTAGSNLAITGGFQSSYGSPLGLTNPLTGPASLYTTYHTGDAFTMRLPDVTDGTYTLRLHVWSTTNTIGGDAFDLTANGTQVLTAISARGLAGASYTLAVVDVTVTVAGGAGLTLQFAAPQSTNPLFAAMELLRAVPAGLASPTVRLEASSDDGATWTTVATGITLDRYGAASHNWTPSEDFADTATRLRAVSEQTGTEGTASGRVQIGNNGRDFYINDSSLTGDQYTTAPGDDANTGKSADAPMATLANLLAAYDLAPGDRVFVDTGLYSLTRNIVIGAGDAGSAADYVAIFGPTQDGAEAIFDRGSRATGSNVIDINGGDYVRISDLTLRNADYGINIFGGSDFVSLNRLTISDTGRDGIFGANDSHDLTITDAVVTRAAQTSGYAMQLRGDRTSVIGGEVKDNVNYGILFTSEATDARVTGTTFARNTRTALDMHTGTVRDITVTQTGGNVNTFAVYLSSGVVDAANLTVTNNAGGGVYIYSGVLRDSIITGNTTGISTQYARIENNYLDANTAKGIVASTYSDNVIIGNAVINSQIGIDIGSGFQSTPLQVVNNLIRGEATRTGILANIISGNAILQNNTLVLGPLAQVGVAISGSSNRVDLRNTLIQMSAGRAVTVAADAQLGFTSDYNQYDLTGTCKAKVSVAVRRVMRDQLGISG